MKSTLSEKYGHSVAMKKEINDSSIKEKMFLISLLEISKMTNILLFIPTLHYTMKFFFKEENVGIERKEQEILVLLHILTMESQHWQIA